MQSWLVPQCQLYGMKLPTRFQLIGQVGLAEYTKWTRWFLESHSQPVKQNETYLIQDICKVGCDIIIIGKRG